MSHLTLYWHLREICDGPLDGEPSHSNWHDERVAADALAAEDILESLNQARLDPEFSPEQRQHAADLLTEHLWPDDRGVQSSTVIEIDHTTDDSGSLVTIYSVDEETQRRDGYHFGGFWLPHIASAETLSCRECNFSGEFWDFDTEPGEHTPMLRCPVCQTVPTSSC